MSNEELRKQIRGNLNLKETDELLSIWQINNRAHWSDEAFDAIKELLQQRGVEIPVQNEPVYQAEEKTADEEIPDDDGLEEWEARVLDDENQPEFYDTLEVITLNDHINKVAKAVILVNILSGIAGFQWMRSVIGAYFPNASELMPLIYFIAFIVTTLSVAVGIAIVYFPLKALSQLLRILMEMEFTSRKGG